MTSIPILTADDAVARLRRSVHEKAAGYYAMYSSVLGAIVTDPALMVLPLDDHMVHRGHAVFDTATLTGGMIYQLDAHLDRLMQSAETARITPPFAQSELRRIIIETAAASRRRDGSIRYWLSAGPGGFGLGPSECVASSFYVIVFKQEAYPESYYSAGMKVVTSSVPIKPPLFARTKSNNYLPNVLVVLEAKDRGADNGIFVDARGMVAESSNMNVAFVTRDRVFRHPAFDAILSGITIQRVLKFAEQLVDEGVLSGVRLGDIAVDEGRHAEEMMLIGSSIKVAPVVEWDGQRIGSGRPGPIARKLLEMWHEDTRSARDQLVPVPYM
ncbi:MAG TPA: aminotransferase class IV [Candidatus Eisenbacteria bacterium]|nr:aminotransferase class IV [Candidatus Eisenbacteria bacterium]